MAKFCGFCGCRQEDGAAFCTQCGSPLEKRSPASEHEPTVAIFSEERPMDNSGREIYSHSATGRSVSAPSPRADRPPTPPLGVNSAPRRRVTDFDPSTFDVAPPAQPKKRRTGLIVGIVIGLLLAAAAAIFFLFFNPFEPKEEAAPAPTESTSAPTQAPTQLPTQPPTQRPTEAPTQPPTQPPTERPTERPTDPPTQPPTAPPAPTIYGGADSIRGVIQIAFDNYYFPSRDADRYLSILYEYNFSMDMAARRALRDRYQAAFADTSELKALEKKFGSDMAIRFTVTDTETLSGKAYDDAVKLLTADCNTRIIEQIVYVTFNTEVAGSVSSEKGLWHGYFYRVGDTWFTNLDFI